MTASSIILMKYKRLLADLTLPAKHEENSMLLVAERCHRALLDHRASEFYLSILTKISQEKDLSIYEYLYYVLATHDITTLDLPSLTTLLDHLRENDDDQYDGIRQVIEVILLARKYTETSDTNRPLAMTELVRALHYDHTYYLNLMGAQIPELQLIPPVYILSIYWRQSFFSRCSQCNIGWMLLLSVNLDNAAITTTSACGLNLTQANITNANIELVCAQTVLLCESNLNNSVLILERCDHLHLRVRQRHRYFTTPITEAQQVSLLKC